MAVFVDPKTGERYENVPDAEAENARTKFGLVDAEAFERQQAIDAKPLGQKTLETVGSGLAGVAAIGNVIGDVIPEALGGYSDEEVQKFNTEFLQSPLVKGLKEEHPIAFALGSSAPAIALGPAVGAAAGGGLAGGVAGTLAESAAVGLGDEAIAAGAEGREFSEEQAVAGAQTDLAFSAAAQALLGVAGRVGNLFLFGGGNTMAKNVGRGLDETVGPVVPDDIRFESPLLEAETRSTRAAAAASPGMPPGPARDEALRRAASDLNEQVRTQGGETLETTVAEAQRSASVADSPVVQRRIDEILTETTPAQTSWSADATQRLDTLRKQLSIDTTRPSDVAAMAGEAEAIRAIDVADEAIRAIDGASDSAEWFKASAAARDRLDAIADAMPESPVAKTIADARDWLGKSLADRGMWGTAADLDSSLRGAARDKVATAARTVGGDLRGHVAAYVDADGAGRAGLRAPIDQAIDGIEELAAAHERFGTATPKQIDALRENAAGLRRRIALADDVRAAEGRAAQQVAEETPAKATMVEQAAEAVASHLEKGGKAALSAGIGRALTTIADFAGIPGAGWVARKIRNKVGDAVADQVIAAAKQYDPASPGAKRVRRIMDRMRARERQRGSISLGPKASAQAGTPPKVPEADEAKYSSILENQRELAEELSEAEKKALKRYTFDIFSEVNKIERGEVPSGYREELAFAEAYKELPYLRQAMSKLSDAIDAPLFHGGNDAHGLLDKLQVGEEFSPGFTLSSSLSERTAQGFSRSTKESPFILRFPEGVRRGVPVLDELSATPGAKEVLIPRDAKFAVVGRATDANGRVIVDLVPISGTEKAREIVERMRAAERQRGAVTLGGKKAERIRTAPRDGTIGQISPDEFSIAGLNHEDLGADKFRPGVLEGLRKDEQFAKTGVPAMGGRAAAKELVIQEGKHGKPLFLNDGSHRLQVAREKGLTHLPGRVEDADGNVIFQGQIRIADPKKGAAPKATGEAGFVQAAPDERQFSLGDIAKSPAGVVTGAGAAWAGVNQLRRDEDLETADRVIAVDDAAQQRVRHTARVLAGLAEPPPAEGLTTALGRFGADFDDPRAAFEERKSILEKAATAPTLVYDVIGSALGDVARVSPELFQAASQRLLEGFQYLRDNLPAEVKTSMLYPTGVPPSESAMRDWATQWSTVMDPESVLEDIERGTVSHLQIRTLEGAHPDIYQSMRTEVIAEVGANFQDIPWSTKMQLDLLFQADGLAGPMFSSKAAAMIGEAQNASQRKAPGPVDPSAGDAAADGPSGLNAIKSSVTNRSA